MMHQFAAARSQGEMHHSFLCFVQSCGSIYFSCSRWKSLEILPGVHPLHQVHVAHSQVSVCLLLSFICSFVFLLVFRGKDQPCVHSMCEVYLCYSSLRHAFILGMHVRACRLQLSHKGCQAELLSVQWRYNQSVAVTSQRSQSQDYARTQVFKMRGRVFKISSKYDVAVLIIFLQVFTVTQFILPFRRKFSWFFGMMRPQWRDCRRRLCNTMPPSSTALTTQSSRWNERSASQSQSSVDERKRWQWIFSPWVTRV